MNNPFFLVRKVITSFNILPEVDDYEKIHEEIKKGVVFKGTNLWILVFAIVVASVGLNMNSTAVIIGAMLISPLMGPINGIGYSIATYNFGLFRLSLKNLLFAVASSLVASTAYFFISPVSTAHSELLARTSPTIYDVLIALFGGLAGIIALSSKQKGNVIPGVAIATALMPPLCTAGYGLATAQFDFFFGAFYLFTINSVFIALSSLVVSQFLKFPLSATVEQTQRKKINTWLSIVIAIVLLPSVYFGYNLIKNERFNEYSKTYISNISMYEGNFLLKSDVDVPKRTITLVYGGLNLTENQKNDIISKAELFELNNAKIIIKQGLTFESENKNNDEVFKLKEELIKLNQLVRNKQHAIDSLNSNKFFGRDLFNEIRVIFPQINSCTYSFATKFNDEDKIIQTHLLVFNLKEKLNDEDKEKIRNWAQSRLNSNEIQLIFN